MTRRLVTSLVLGVVLVVLQLLAGNGLGVALVTGLIGLVVAYLVLLVSDRWFRTRR
jgi:hypothetical protein